MGKILIAHPLKKADMEDIELLTNLTLSDQSLLRKRSTSFLEFQAAVNTAKQLVFLRDHNDHPNNTCMRTFLRKNAPQCKHCKGNHLSFKCASSSRNLYQQRQLQNDQDPRDRLLILPPCTDITLHIPISILKIS